MSKKDDLISLPGPAGSSFDASTEVLRVGARQLIRQVVEIRRASLCAPLSERPDKAGK